METLSPEQTLSLLSSAQQAFIDVRSEGEFQDGHIPGFTNGPILTDSERHAVGLTYKQQGQAPAIEVGQRLVAPHREERLRAWQKQIDQSPLKAGVITCWRGGLRSKIAAEWLREAGCDVVRVEGGYKALRHQILSSLERPPPFVVLTGLTGTGKTKLLTRVRAPKIDLENLAAHRGSSFGQDLFTPQPSQATFENRLGLGLRLARGPLLVEDESRLIGKVCLPNAIKQQITVSPVVILESPIHERVRLIFEQYVREPVARGRTPAFIKEHMLRQLGFLKRHLGGLLFAELSAQIKDAFALGLDLGSHDGWIRTLLLRHYDPRYRHAFHRLERKVLFQGEYDDCLKFIESAGAPSLGERHHQPEMI